MEVTFITYLIVCPMIFIAGFIDSIAGGGGLISLPIYLSVGLPPAVAAGTNKLSAGSGTLVSLFKYFKSGNITLKIALISAAFAFIGSVIGARIAISLGETLRYVILGIIPFAATAAFFTPKKRERQATGTKLLVFAALIGLIIGTYDGIAGPCTGSFLIILYVYLCSFTHKEASGNAKIVNLSSNVAAFIVFALNGSVLYKLALPAAAFGILGNYLGSSLAIKNGKKIIKPILSLILIGACVKIIIDIL